MNFYCENCSRVTSLDVPDIDFAHCGHCDKVIAVPKHRYDNGVVINGDFVIEEHVGTGGMGLVYRARQISLERTVALKILKDSFSKDRKFVDKFIKEARSAANLRHQNIVQSYAVGMDKGTFYIAMEFVDGQTVTEMLLRKRKFREEETVKTALAACKALDYSWKETQLLHRDIKPDNIMIDRQGNVKVMDLGLSCSYSDLTQHEEVIGTPQYISPDQLQNSFIDFRADQYSLGASLFHMITGTFPYDAETAEETALLHIKAAIPNPKSLNNEISPDLTAIIMKMMSKVPEKRYSSYTELMDALKAVKPPRKKKVISRKRKPARREPVYDTVSNIDSVESSNIATAHFKKYSDLNDILKYSCIAVIVLALILAMLVLVK